jgi:hypothetical protein
MATNKTYDDRIDEIANKYSIDKPSSARRPSMFSPVYRGVGEVVKGAAGSGLETIGGLGGLAAKVIPGKQDDEYFQRFREKGASMRGSSGAAQLGGFAGDILSITLGGAGIAARASKLPAFIKQFSKVKGIKAFTPVLPEAAASTALTGLQQQDQIKSGELSSQFAGEIITGAAAGKGLGYLAKKYKAAKQIPTEGLQIPSGTQQAKGGALIPSGAQQVRDGLQLPSGTQQVRDGLQLPSGTQQAKGGAQIPSGTQQAKEGVQYISDKVLQKKVQPIAKELKESTFLTPDAPFIRLIANAKPETRNAISNKLEQIKKLTSDPNLQDEIRRDMYVPLISDSIKSSFENGKTAGEMLGSLKSKIQKNKKTNRGLKTFISQNVEEFANQLGFRIAKDGSLIDDGGLITATQMRKILNFKNATPKGLIAAVEYLSDLQGSLISRNKQTAARKIGQLKQAIDNALASGLDKKSQKQYKNAKKTYSKYKDAQKSIFSLLNLSDKEKAVLTKHMEMNENDAFNQKVADKLRRAANLNFANLLDPLETINKSASKKIDIKELKRTANLVENILKTSGGESVRTITPLITTAIEMGVPKLGMFRQAGKLAKELLPGVELDLGQAEKNAKAIEALIRIFGK